MGIPSYILLMVVAAVIVYLLYAVIHPDKF